MEAKVLSGLFEVYASGGARAFFPAHYANREDRVAAVHRAIRPLDPRLAAALEAQNPKRERELAKLKGGAAAVVTGQQVGLFLGPLYTVYKAATAIAVARALELEAGRPVVPIFWLQTDDHDLVEIASTVIPGANGAPITVSVPADPGEKISLSHRVLPAEVTQCLSTLRAELGRLPHGEEHLARLERHYRVGRGFAPAFAEVLAELFGPEGLVLIDSRDPQIAAHPATIEVHRRALARAEDHAKLLSERARALDEAGFRSTVHVRDGAPLSFFHPQGAGGPRYRLEPAPGGGFREVGGDHVHTRAALLAALEADPLSFTTSALLRPILQDTLLPTAAYVGGPGEIAYFAQLAPLYRAHERSMPPIVPRARFQIVEEKTLRILARLGVTAEQASFSEDALLSAARALDRAPFQPEELEANLAGELERVLDAVASKIEPIGEGIDTAIEKTRASIKMAIAKLRDKYERALLHQDRTLVEDVRRLRALLYPNGQPQERVYGVSYFAARYGERAFIEKVLGAIVPFDPALKELRP